MSLPNLEDRAGIDDLYARYYWAFDTGDSEAYVNTFIEDAELVEYWKGSVLRSVGRQEIRNYVLKILGDTNYVGHQHRGSPPLIDPDPAGRPQHWRVRAYVFSMTLTPGEQPIVRWTGYVDDIVTRQGSRYLFERKQIQPWGGDILSKYGL